MGNIKVLLADRVKSVIAREKSALSRINCTILDAVTGQEALDLIYAERPKLVVLDFDMPEIEGLEICKKVKQDTELKGVKIIMVCMIGRERNIKACIAAGCDDTLLKPFTRSDLLGKIQVQLGISAREHERFPMVTKVHISLESDGKISNISKSGCFIEMNELYNPGTVIKVRFLLPGDGTIIDTKAEVMRLQKGVGMGVKFIKLAEGQKESLKTYTEKLENA